MKILNLSLDNKLYSEDAGLIGRLAEYASLVETYQVIAPSRYYKRFAIGSNSEAICSGGSNKLSQLFRIFRLASKELSKKEIDLITVQDQYYLGWLASFLAGRFGVALEVQLHGWEKARGLRRILAGRLFAKADGIRTVSQRLKKELVDNFHIEEERVVVVPIRSESPQAAEHTQALPSESEKTGKLIFLTIGRLVDVKNIALQIRAIAELHKEYPRIELLIVGDGPLKQELQDLANELGIGGSVRMEGWQHNLEKYYQEADAFLLTSNAEGWGLVAVEAAAYGLPIIMTDVGLAGEVLINEKSALIVRINDVKALTGAMERLFKDQSLRQRLGEAAKEAVSQLPTKAETLELYKKSWENALILHKKSDFDEIR